MKISQNVKYKYSIIIPALNEELFIRRCVASFACQENVDFDYEVIVVDNGSSDSTRINAQNCYLGTISKLRVVHQEIKGVSRAKNLGAKVAEGEYLIFIDADNVVGNNFLSILDKHIQKTGSDAATICLTGDENSSIFSDTIFIILELIKRNFYRPFGKSVVKNWLFDLHRFDNNIKLGENVDMLLRVKDYCKENNLVFSHFSKSPLFCSDRRFVLNGHFSTLWEWLLGYVGVKRKKYETMVEVQSKNNKSN